MADKVVCVSVGPCHYCEDGPHPLVLGRVYTVVHYEAGEFPDDPGIYELAEALNSSPEFGWCGCGLRPVNGDPDGWREIVRSLSPNRQKEDA